MQEDLTSHGTEGLQCTWRQDKILDRESPEYDGENGPELAAQPETASLDIDTLAQPVMHDLNPAAPNSDEEYAKSSPVQSKHIS